MKKYLLLIFAAATLLASCGKESVTPAAGTGKLMLSAKTNVEVTLKDGISTDSYTVTISKKEDASFTPIVKKVSELASAIDLTAGTYVVAVKSVEFTAPAFDAPTYGAEQEVTITAGQTTTANITCTQLNAGVKLNFTSDLDAYCTAKGYEYGATVAIKSTPSSFLDYGKKNGTDNTLNTGIGYFAAGDVTVKVKMNGNEYTKDITLGAKQRWTINVGVNKLNAPMLKVTVTGDDGATTEPETLSFTEQ
jgi:hypothetical protein